LLKSVYAPWNKNFRSFVPRNFKNIKKAETCLIKFLFSGTKISSKKKLILVPENNSKNQFFSLFFFLLLFSFLLLPFGRLPTSTMAGDLARASLAQGRRASQWLGEVEPRRSPDLTQPVAT